MKSETNSKGIWIFIVAVIIFVLCAMGSSDTTTDYYIDYNKNGKMDKGEYVYSEDEDGTEHWDLDGDGWWDT